MIKHEPPPPRDAQILVHGYSDLKIEPGGVGCRLDEVATPENHLKQVPRRFAGGSQQIRGPVWIRRVRGSAQGVAPERDRRFGHTSPPRVSLAVMRPIPRATLASPDAVRSTASPKSAPC